MRPANDAGGRPIRSAPEIFLVSSGAYAEHNRNRSARDLRRYRFHAARDFGPASQQSDLVPDAATKRAVSAESTAHAADGCRLGFVPGPRQFSYPNYSFDS